MILVVCMAGLNTRFHNVGFDVPKYLLPWDNGAIIESILRGLTEKRQFEKIFLLPNKRDVYFKEQLIEAVSKFGIGEQDIVFIGDTKGQAHTAALGAQVALEASVNAATPIAFHNADTIVEKRNFAWIAETLENKDAHIDIFSASSPQYSYVRLEGGKVTRIAEKNVISPFASSGLYAFSSIDLYLNYFNNVCDKKSDSEGGENFITDVLQDIVSSGGDVFANEISDAMVTTVLGTPEEYGIEFARLTLTKCGMELARLNYRK